jgi:hypothetical protein
VATSESPVSKNVFRSQSSVLAIPFATALSVVVLARSNAYFSAADRPSRSRSERLPRGNHDAASREPRRGITCGPQLAIAELYGRTFKVTEPPFPPAPFGPVPPG